MGLSSVEGVLCEAQPTACHMAARACAGCICQHWWHRHVCVLQLGLSCSFMNMDLQTGSVVRGWGLVI